MTALQYRLFLASIPLALTCLQLVLAYALAMERAWPRPLAVALPLGWVVMPAVSPELYGSRFAAVVESSVPAVTISLLAALYLYGSPRVRAYYDRLALAQAARDAPMHAETR